MTNQHHHPYAPSQRVHSEQRQCLSCVKRQIEVWIHDGQPCPQCGLGDPGPSIKGKDKRRVHRKKVADRHKFTKGSISPDNGEKLPKESIEAHNRFLQIVALSRQQNQLLACNPNLPRTAARGEGHEEGGFTFLKSNNTSPDTLERRGVEPLIYKKVEVMDTITLAFKQCTDGLLDAESGLDSLLAEYRNYAQIGLSPMQLAALLGSISQLRDHTRALRRAIARS
jgi:hypothetical protein